MAMGALTTLTSSHLGFAQAPVPDINCGGETPVEEKRVFLDCRFYDQEMQTSMMRASAGRGNVQLLEMPSVQTQTFGHRPALSEGPFPG